MKSISPLRIVLLAILVAALALGATACGGGSSGGGGGSSSGGGGGGGGTPINATEKDFSITLAKTTVSPGTYTFHVVNNGPSSHDFTINGPGVANKKTGLLSSGSSQDLTVTLTSGTYDVYCSVPGHKAAGMDTKLTVS
jgi:plastocyanin